MRFLYVVPLALAFVFLSACSGGAEKAETQTVSAAELKMLADSIVESVAAGNSDYLFEKIRYDHIFSLTISGLSLGTGDTRDYKREVENKVRDFCSDIITYDQSEGDYVYLGTGTDARGPSLVFVKRENAPVNYHEFFVEKVNGRLRISNFMIYSQGNLYSDVLRERLRAVLRKKKHTNLFSFLGARHEFDPEAQAAVERMGNARTEAENGNLAEAWALYNQIPDSFRNVRNFALMELDVAMHDEDSVYLAACDRYVKKFADKISAPLYGLYLYRQQGEHQKLLDGASALYKRTHDPDLFWYKASAYYNMEDYANSISYYQQLSNLQPTDKNSWFNLAYIYSFQEKYDSASYALNGYAKILQAPFQTSVDSFTMWKDEDWVMKDLYNSAAFRRMYK